MKARDLKTKKLKTVKKLFKITKETGQILKKLGYSEDNISELVKEIRNED